METLEQSCPVIYSEVPATVSHRKRQRRSLSENMEEQEKIENFIADAPGAA
jgi:hypothetical protein